MCLPFSGRFPKLEWRKTRGEAMTSQTTGSRASFHSLLCNFKRQPSARRFKNVVLKNVSHVTFVLGKLLPAVRIPENSKDNAEKPKGNRLCKEAFNVLCFCYLFIRPAGNLCSQRTLHHWLQIQFLCLRSNGLKNRGESQI